MHVESGRRRLYAPSPFTAVYIDLIHVSPAVQGNIWTRCLVYHLFCEAKVKVNIPWICLVCSAQFVEIIDLCFFFCWLSSVLKDKVSP